MVYYYYLVKSPFLKTDRKGGVQQGEATGFLISWTMTIGGEHYRGVPQFGDSTPHDAMGKCRPAVSFRESLVLLNRLKHSSNYMRHLLYNLENCGFSYRVYSCVSCGSK
jgi:hypothetical protein